MPFERGKAANPAGRNQHTAKADKVEFKDLCVAETPLAFKRIRALAKDKQVPPTTRLNADQFIIEHAHGKPEAAQSATQGMFAGATILVDTGIKRTLEPPTINGESHAVDASLDMADKAVTE